MSVTKSLGRVYCPVCQTIGRLKADLRNKTTYYSILHSEKETKRYPYYGKYRSTCYLGKAGSFDLGMIQRA